MTDGYDRAALWARVEFRPLGHPCRPRFVRYKVARPRRFAVALNRYPFSVIGVGIVIGARCYSLRWATPARYKPKIQAWHVHDWIGPGASTDEPCSCGAVAPEAPF